MGGAPSARGGLVLGGGAAGRGNRGSTNGAALQRALSTTGYDVFAQIAKREPVAGEHLDASNDERGGKNTGPQPRCLATLSPTIRANSTGTAFPNCRMVSDQAP